MTYARLLIGDLLEAHVQRCVYVDSDLLFERDVAELEETDLQGKIVGAVPNGLTEAVERDDLERLGPRAGSRYLNAGVLVIDLLRWRQSGIGEACLRLCAEEDFRIPDQDAINVVLGRDAILLPHHWNSWARRTDHRGSRVIHFAMAPKPWDADYQGAFAEEFYSYLDRTAFAGQRPWNPFGIGALATRLRRRIPYVPSAWRLLRKSIGLP